MAWKDLDSEIYEMFSGLEGCLERNYAALKEHSGLNVHVTKAEQNRRYAENNPELRKKRTKQLIEYRKHGIGKEKQRDYQKTWRSKPENKRKYQDWQNEYRKRPEVRAKKIAADKALRKRKKEERLKFLQDSRLEAKAARRSRIGKGSSQRDEVDCSSQHTTELHAHEPTSTHVSRSQAA